MAMGAESVAAIAAVTVVAVQLIKWGMPSIDGGRALGAVALVSLLGVGLWALSSGLAWSGEHAWPLFSAWVMTMASSAGVYGFVAAPLRRSADNDEHRESNP